MMADVRTYTMYGMVSSSNCVGRCVGARSWRGRCKAVGKHRDERASHIDIGTARKGERAEGRGNNSGGCGRLNSAKVDNGDNGERRREK